MNALSVRSQALKNDPEEQGEQAGGGRVSVGRPCLCPVASCSPSLFSISDDLREPESGAHSQLPSVLLRATLRPSPLLLTFKQRSRDGGLQEDDTVRSLKAGQMGQTLGINLSEVIDGSYSAIGRRRSLWEWIGFFDPRQNSEEGLESWSQ